MHPRHLYPTPIPHVMLPPAKMVYQELGLGNINPEATCSYMRGYTCTFHSLDRSESGMHAQKCSFMIIIIIVSILCVHVGWNISI